MRVQVSETSTLKKFIFEGGLNNQCTDCQVAESGSSVKVSVNFDQPDHFQVSSTVYVNENQNVRVAFSVLDYLATVSSNNAFAQTELNFTLEYSDETTNSPVTFICSTECINGVYNGAIDLANSRNDTVKVKLQLSEKRNSQKFC